MYKGVFYIDKKYIGSVDIEIHRLNTQKQTDTVQQLNAQEKSGTLVGSFKRKVMEVIITALTNIRER
jgi:hypothetical protein